MSGLTGMMPVKVWQKEQEKEMGKKYLQILSEDSRRGWNIHPADPDSLARVYPGSGMESGNWLYKVRRGAVPSRKRDWLVQSPSQREAVSTHLSHPPKEKALATRTK